MMKKKMIAAMLNNRRRRRRVNRNGEIPTRNLLREPGLSTPLSDDTFWETVSPVAFTPLTGGWRKSWRSRIQYKRSDFNRSSDD